MDFFQGSSPPNFISFCLENYPPEDQTLPAGPSQTQPPITRDVAPEVLASASAFYSPQSATSEVDVNSYAEAMVQHLESKQGTGQDNQATVGEEGELTTSDVLEGQTDQAVLIPRGASNPIPVGGTEESHLSLTALESALVIATSSSSQYPELLTAAEEVQGDQSRTAPQSKDDNTSSVYEVPALPGNEPKVRFLADLSEGEKTSEETSSLGKTALYGHIPGIGESGTEAGDESGPVTPHHQDPIASTSRGLDDQLPDLSGRSRAILKTYFLEEKAFNLPRGHPTLAFTEPQIYHLLRVLTDETLRMSHTNMEQMILDAVRGRPTALPSRTDTFRSMIPSVLGESDDQDTQSHAETGDSSFSGESDSTGEMALISASYKPVTRTSHTWAETATLAVSDDLRGQDTDPSSQDATLSEVREQTLSGKSRRNTRAKKSPKPKRQSQRGVPMREEFFAKIG